MGGVRLTEEDPAERVPDEDPVDTSFLQKAGAGIVVSREYGQFATAVLGLGSEGRMQGVCRAHER